MVNANPTSDDARYTIRMSSVVHNAFSHACRTRSDQVGVDHLLLGLLSAGEGVGLRVLSALGVDLESLREYVKAGIPQEPDPDEDEPFTVERFMRGLEHRDRLQLSDEAQAVMAIAADEGDDHIGTEHILVGLLRYGGGGLAAFGVTLEDVRSETECQLAEFLHGRPTVMDASAADQLIAVERITLPADIRDLGEQITLLRQQKESAVDARDFEAAAHMRDHEKVLLARRTELLRDWATTVDVLALVEEVEALRAAVGQLHPRSAGPPEP